MGFTRKKTVLWGGAASVLTIGVIMGVTGAMRSGHKLQAGPAETSHAAPQDAGESAIPVKTVRPKPNRQELVRSVSQPAFVKGFYLADLMAHVAGPVKSVRKNIGDLVTEGEVLVELDVPDLAQEVAQREALVRQAEQDARAAEANVPVVEAQEEEAKKAIAEKEAIVDFRAKRLERYGQLSAKKAVVDLVFDEEKRDLVIAERAVETARANWKEFQAKSAAARVDVEVKRARVEVAKADLARARTMVDFAKIRAPFDGAVVSRRVDPGAFVQNASTGHPSPLLTIVRIDVVTLVMWVPEKDVPLVTKDTEAVIRLDALGDRELRAKVTRFSNWLDPEKSRDMRVEVDLENKEGLLKPGMYGTMKLLLQKFDNTYLVPASAVFERGGKTYLCEVREGKAHLVPVRVQLEDGIQVKVAKILRQTNPKTGQEAEILQDLTGQEEIVRSGQGEIAEGQAVRASPVDR